jgi:hypothetical protein
MKRYPPVVLMTLLACLLTAAWAPVAHGFGVAKWEAGTCITSVGCEYSNHGAFYTQAAGHPAWGLTAFEVAGATSSPALKRIRVDIPPGLAADPVTLPSCSTASFEANACPAETKAGMVELKAYVEIPLAPQTLPLKGNVYSLGERPGLPLLFGIDVEGVKPVVKDVHLLLEGHVSDTHEGHAAPSGDYHEYFEINNIPTKVSVEVAVPILGSVTIEEAGLKTVESKLYFNGHAGRGNFLTLPSTCSSTTASYLELESYAGEHSSAVTHAPVGVTGCGSVPFKPTAAVAPETGASKYDTGDGTTTEVHVPQNEGSNETNTSDIADAHVTLPEGLTLNPSAAHGLGTCTPAEIAIGEARAVSCPSSSQIGTVNIETDLPPKSLSGRVFLGNTGAGPIKGPPYTIYLDAESVYGVSLRLQGQAVPNPASGRLEVSFLKNPQLPFSSLSLKLNGGARAPLANPDSCAAAPTAFDFTPWTGGAAFNGTSSFIATGCPSPIPFAPAQSTGHSSNKGGAFTSYTFSLKRTDAQQNLGSVQAVLPAGLVGLIPSVPRCAEPLANAGSCPAASEIGKATASAGVGAEPYDFSGPVYLTGPTNGAPYGLSIPIEAAAGPFDLGRVTTRVAISVEPHTGRVIATSTLPRIVGGVPLRLRSLSVAITKSKFLFNPSYCGALATDSTLGSLTGALSKPSSPFQVTDCKSLPFKPHFTAASPTAPSRANGASLEVGYTQSGHQANIRSVVASLPKVLPSRDSTLKLSCPEATFASGYQNCPSGSKVGSATVGTPVLPDKLTGPAYLVSHGGAAFPDLDLILQGDGGVKVILVGNTDITNGITTSTFASVPDVPVSSFLLKLPTASNSLLGSFGSLCTKPLYMPTVITAQNGAQIKQKTRLSIGSCKIKLLSHRVRGHFLILRVKTFTAGRLGITSPGLHPTYRKIKGPGVTTIKVALSTRGRNKLAAGILHVRVRVGFNPRHKDEFRSAVFARAVFRH